ncbi:MAG TPA: nucleoside triphosphate pyrophosphatase [Micromonosporaceae bacterium]|nr:nucleoside triphosphate pyrophosphatase [Micromonosporaceae bacterium]
MTSRRRFVLASASPARLRTLRAAGLDPEVLVTGVDESTVQATNPAELAGTLARLKAEAAVRSIRSACTDSAGGAAPIVLGCDSVLEFAGQVHGKPAGAAEAVQRWRQMRGRTGVLHTGHCVIDTQSDALAEEVAATVVRFAEISDAEIEAYVETGEPLQVAGAFTIDGLGGWFVEGVDGDPGNVIGVSLPLLRRLLRRLGVSVPQLWQCQEAADATPPAAT